MSNTKILKPHAKAVQNRLDIRYVAIKNYGDVSKKNFFLRKSSQVFAEIINITKSYFSIATCMVGIKF